MKLKNSLGFPSASYLWVSKLLSAVVLLSLINTSPASERVNRVIRPFVGVNTDSGVVIKQMDGYTYILTAKHVIERPDNSMPVVTFYSFNQQGRLQSSQKITAEDRFDSPTYDYAIVAVRGINGTVAVQAPSISSLSLLDDIWTVGLPEGQLWARRGVLSSLSEKRIGHDAGTWSGCSGGPIYDDQYRLIGINIGIIGSQDNQTKVRQNIEGVGIGLPLSLIYDDIRANRQSVVGDSSTN